MTRRECLIGHAAAALLCSVSLCEMFTATAETLPLHVRGAADATPGVSTRAVTADDALTRLLQPAPLADAPSLTLGADLLTLSYEVPPADLRALNQYLKQLGTRAGSGTLRRPAGMQDSARSNAATPLLAAGWLMLPVLGALSLRGRPVTERRED